MWSTLLLVVINLYQIKGNLKDFVLWEIVNSNSPAAITSPPTSEGVLLCALVEAEGDKVGVWGGLQQISLCLMLYSYPLCANTWHLGVVSSKRRCNTPRPTYMPIECPMVCVGGQVKP